MKKVFQKKVNRKEVVFSISIIVAVITIAVISALVQNHLTNSIPPFEERVESHEVLSVYKYAKDIGNLNENIKICYSFSYLEGDTLKHIDDFSHQDNGRTKVIFGETDLYIIDSYTNEEYLQLTKETLKALTGTSE